MSLVNIVGEQTDKNCGYCKTGKSASFGLVCEKMKVNVYEDLMLKGWRRCGNYYYKPNIPKSCCKLNTIRLDASIYEPNKNQRKVMKKFQRYLSGNNKKCLNKAEKRGAIKEMLTVPEELYEKVKNAVISTANAFGVEFTIGLCVIKRNSPNREAKFGNYSISSALAINAKIKQKGEERSLDEINEVLKNSLLPEIENSKWKTFSAEKGFINLTEEGISEIKVPETQSMNIESTPHTYEFELVNDDFSQESFEIYREYQITVHKDPPKKISPNGYESFLCKSSLVKEAPTSEYPFGLGSFHMLHKIDGRLVAVSVLDVLPSGLSAVYFFYSPSITFLSPGVFSAIKELEFIQKNISGNFKYYYMGFYVDSCQKMRYKGEFHPSELLCPVNYLWVPIKDCISNKSHNFISLSQCSPTTNSLPKNPEMDFSNLDVTSFVIENAKICLNRQIYKVTDLNPRGMQIVLDILIQALSMVGKNLFKRLIYSF